ncbi:MAG: hypothetical protein JWO12_3288, partial [Frankiales bacterium]|nr:hypothetical protein [Frankiales bacterium]
MELAVVCPPSRQGLATLAQLKTAGVNRHAVAKAVRDAVLVRTHRGVYSPAALPEVATHLLSGGVIDKGYLAWVRSVLLSLGKDCMAARRTAAALWGFDMYIEPHDVEVAVPLDRGRTSLVGVLVLRRSRTAVSRHVLG